MELSPGTTVCDVGGGIGTMLMQLAQTYPHLQLKLQDLPERVMQAQNEIWPFSCPEALEDGRIEFKAMDFFTESPIKGCDIYYVRSTTILWWTPISRSRPGTAEVHHVRDDEDCYFSMLTQR